MTDNLNKPDQNYKKSPSKRDSDVKHEDIPTLANSNCKYKCGFYPDCYCGDMNGYRGK